MRFQMILVASVVAACGGPTQPPESVEPEIEVPEADDGESAEPDEETEHDEKAGGTESVPQPEGGCPATKKEATGYCVVKGAKYVPTVCQYPEGTCRCGPPKKCGGMAPKPVPMEKWTWSCESPPPDVLPDGCPGKLPAAGDPCSDEGKVCYHGHCCVQKLECIGGKWKIGPPMCPP
jgi:hypothetical protein